MRAGVCVTCVEVFEGSVRSCPRCGSPLADRAADLLAWERARQRRRIDAWLADGVIDDETANELISRLAQPLAADDAEAAPPPPLEPRASAVERRADGLVSGAAALFGEVSARWTKITHAIDEDAPPSSQRPRAGLGERDDAHLDASRAIFAGQGRTAAVVAAGIEALAALDEEAPASPRAEIERPFGALQVFWFIGTLLVLAGSVMGVREAWRTLEGVWRPVVIAGALFAYHVLFVGLARLLARRSAVTGRVLAVIAAGLLPVVFVAAAVAIGQRASVAGPVAALLLAASGLTLVVLGRAAFDRGSGAALAAGLVPALGLELALGAGGVTPLRRVALALVALVPVALVSLRVRRAVTSAALVGLGAAAYGALATFLLAVYGGPGDPVLPVEGGSQDARALLVWLASAAAIAWWATSGPAMAVRFPRRGAVPSILAVAVLASTSVAAFAMSFVDAGEPGLTTHAPLVVLVLGTGVLAFEQRTRSGALHVAIMLAMATSIVVARTIAPLGPELRPAMWAVLPAGLLVLVGVVTDRRRRFSLACWGILLGAGALVVQLAVEGSAALPSQPWPISAATAGMLAVSAHAAGRSARPILHHFGAAFAFVGASAVFLPWRPEPWIHTFMFVCAGLAAVYGALGLAYDLVAAKDDERRPLDDISLLLAFCGTWLGVVCVDVALAAVFAADTRRQAGWLAMPAVALAGVLLARALRDRSALVVLQAAVALALAAHVGMGVRAVAPGVFLAGVLALALLVPAALRAPRAEGAPRFGRAVFGLVPLPLGGGGRRLLDGFGLGGLLLAMLAAVRALSWMGGPLDEFERPLVVLGLAAVIAAALAAFLTRGLDVLRARGSVMTLLLAGVAIGLAAVANRIGRPLPPEVVGVRIPLILAGVWFVARAFVQWGPRLGEALDRPQDGPRYHMVPHAGVAALVLLLLADAYLVGAPTWTRALAVTPPLFFVGAAVGLLLLARSFGRESLLHAAFLSTLAASALGFAQRAIRGPSLVPLLPPGGRWVPAANVEMARVDWLDPARFLSSGDTEALLWDRAWLGLSVAALGLGALLAASTRLPALSRPLRALVLPAADADEDAIGRALLVSILVAAILLVFGLAWQPRVPSAVAFFVAAALAAATALPSYRAVALVLAAPVLVHALAHRGAIVPDWGGPAMAGLALAAVLGGRVLSERRGRDVPVLAATQAVAIVYAPMALVHGFAAGGPTSPLAAAPGLLALASAAGIASYAPAVTSAILAVTVAAAAFTWRGGLAQIIAAGASLVLAIAAVLFAAAFTSIMNGSEPAALVTREGALLGATLALVAASSHVSAIAAARVRREDTAGGFGVGRDVVLVATTLGMALHVGYGDPGGLLVGPCGVVALGVALAVSFHAAASGGTGRHVLLVETLLVAFYAFATRSLALRPEIDALVGLLYAFSLLGVAAVARRRRSVPVADATRRFAAALPFVLLLVTTTDGATAQAAGIALGSSVLYGTMAYVEKSRIFGTFAAAFANLAIVVFALAQGLDGIEVYIGPLGILVTALSQIFASKLSSAARDALRLLGGALLYLPAGLKLTLRLGEAADGTYSVIFGVVCLLGVTVGLVLRVRAYLALGTLFLTLDVIANLVHAGLRDHRIGFVLLSVSGLLILGVMIAITVRRDAAWALVRRLRARLRGWD
jgi:hypothetical protein